jgi:hypothetical protein
VVEVRGEDGAVNDEEHDRGDFEGLDEGCLLDASIVDLELRRINCNCQYYIRESARSTNLVFWVLSYVVANPAVDEMLQ